MFIFTVTTDATNDGPKLMIIGASKNFVVHALCNEQSSHLNIHITYSSAITDNEKKAINKWIKASNLPLIGRWGAINFDTCYLTKTVSLQIALWTIAIVLTTTELLIAVIHFRELSLFSTCAMVAERSSAQVYRRNPRNTGPIVLKSLRRTSAISLSLGRLATYGPVNLKKRKSMRNLR